MNLEFKADRYEIQAQRHIYPLYMKDGVGGYQFSSTLTFITFRNMLFLVFAAHAIPPGVESIDEIGVLTTKGEFMSLSEVAVNFKIDRAKDLVAVLTTGAFEQKNYFDLDNDDSSSEFLEDFNWIGFPQKKAVKDIHRTKASSEKVQQYVQNGTDGQKKWTNAEFLLIGVKYINESNGVITGEYINKDVTYKHDGFKQQGYSLKGMSGGALFRMSKITTAKELRLYYLAGIGLEYKQNRLVKGASKASVKEFLSVFLP